MMPASSKALFAGVSGTILQWYDFSLFAYVAPILASQFFPHSDHQAAILNTFALFAVSFILAPVGSMLFGHISDCYGRKKALRFSVLLMTIATTSMALVPTYAAIGIVAPLLFALCRLLQGLSASSEFTGSAVFLLEHAPSGYKNFFGCLTSSAYSIGSLLGAFVTASCLAWLPSWGWRLAFALAAVGGLIVLYLRHQVAESPAYLSSANAASNKPLFQAATEMPTTLLFVLTVAWFVGIVTFGTYVWMPTFLVTHAHLTLHAAITIVTSALLVDASVEPLIALLADKIGAQPVMLLGALGFMFLSLPLFTLAATANYWSAWCGVVGLSLLIALSFAPVNAFLIQLFPPHYRASGFGFAFNTGIAIFGGTAPLVLSHLVQAVPSPAFASIYFIAPACVFFVLVSSRALLLAKKSSLTPT